MCDRAPRAAAMAAASLQFLILTGRAQVLLAAAGARAAVEGVGTFASLDLDELADDLEALGLGEALDGLALGVEPEAAAALLLRRDPDVADGGSSGQPASRAEAQQRGNWFWGCCLRAKASR